MMLIFTGPLRCEIILKPSGHQLKLGIRDGSGLRMKADESWGGGGVKCDADALKSPWGARGGELGSAFMRKQIAGVETDTPPRRSPNCVKVRVWANKAPPPRSRRTGQDPNMLMFHHQSSIIKSIIRIKHSSCCETPATNPPPHHP